MCSKLGEVLLNSPNGHMDIFLSDCLTVLLDFMEHGFGQCQQSALLILRNMCCHGNNKPKLMANGRYAHRKI